MNTRILNWLLVLAWMGVMWFFSSIPDLNSGLNQDFVLRKIAHVLEFTVLTILLYRALPAPRHQRWQRFVLAALLAVGYAAVDELHQGYVAGRQASARDVLIDSVGVLLGSAITFLTLHYRQRSTTRSAR